MPIAKQAVSSISKAEQ